MNDGEKLYITAHYAFNYEDSQLKHLMQFDILTQFFEHRNNLKGFINDEKGARVVVGSEIAVLMDSLYEAFDNKDIPGLVKKYLLAYEMYHTLVDFHEPLSIEGLALKKELQEEYNT